ncbi:cystic fibrosis transmembrane conductance regulator [Trichinella spiralis]|uniref:cystic fibrosis transmembrane conductance regulator n=1 Tax=Trichinella spiralis TaxID=6334 RepID=UPI0001EFEBE3|nr:cystic fibrosis transmembrane conductance regulator [Trichinella spiralis]
MIDQQPMVFVNCGDNNRRKDDDEKHHLEKKVLKKVSFTCTRHDSDQQKPIAHDDVDIEDDVFRQLCKYLYNPTSFLVLSFNVEHF